MQEERGLDQGAERAGAGVRRSAFPNTAFSALLYSVLGLPMEAAQVLLEKPVLHRHQDLLHHHLGPPFRDDLLAAGPKKVPIISNSEREREEVAESFNNVIVSFFLCLRSTRQDLFNAVGALYASVMFIGIQNSMMVQPVVDVERTVFYREKAAGMYSALPYAFGQVWWQPHSSVNVLSSPPPANLPAPHRVTPRWSSRYRTSCSRR